MHDFILDQLEGMKALHAKRMFGAYGLYCADIFFGIIAGEKLYFITSAKTKKRYEAYGMRCFQPNQKQVLRSYYQVPLSVLENPTLLKQWADEAIDCAKFQKENRSSFSKGHHGRKDQGEFPVAEENGSGGGV